MNRKLHILAGAIVLAPVVYLAAIWKKLPAIVPMHYNLKGEIDRYGNKTEMLGVLAMMTAVNIGVYLLLNNIHRIDPKKKYTAENRPRMQRLAFVITVFLAALCCFIIYTTQHSDLKFRPGFLLAATGLLFSFIGNYMYTIKPNYFAGFRLPWTLESEDNWKKTHQLAGKLWFAGGIAITIICPFLPNEVALVFFFIAIAVLCIIPAVYSYRFYKQSTRSAS